MSERDATESTVVDLPWVDRGSSTRVSVKHYARDTGGYSHANYVTFSCNGKLMGFAFGDYESDSAVGANFRRMQRILTKGSSRLFPSDRLARKGSARTALVEALRASRPVTPPPAPPAEEPSATPSEPTGVEAWLPEGYEAGRKTESPIASMPGSVMEYPANAQPFFGTDKQPRYGWWMRPVKGPSPLDRLAAAWRAFKEGSQ